MRYLSTQKTRKILFGLDENVFDSDFNYVYLLVSSQFISFTNCKYFALRINLFVIKNSQEYEIINLGSVLIRYGNETISNSIKNDLYYARTVSAHILIIVFIHLSVFIWFDMMERGKGKLL